MVPNGAKPKKCFMFTWKLENACYCWQNARESIASPEFVVDEIEKTKWRLELIPRCGEEETKVALVLIQVAGISVDIRYEIAFLALNGEILHRFEGAKGDKENDTQYNCCVEREALFPVDIVLFNPQNTIITRCKIWRKVGEIPNDIGCIARTRILVEEISFLWKIKQFESSKEMENYTVKSRTNNNELLSLIFRGNKQFKSFITLEDKKIKYFMFKLSIIDEFGNTKKHLSDEIWKVADHKIKEYPLVLKKGKSMSDLKNYYLPGGTLSLKCKCAVTFGETSVEIKTIYSDLNAFESCDLNNSFSDYENNLQVSQNVLDEILPPEFNRENKLHFRTEIMKKYVRLFVDSGLFPDTILKTKSQTYPAHMLILNVRCPEFKFEPCEPSKTHPNIQNCVEITDFDDDTVSRLLKYIYTEKTGQLEWHSTIKLYKAAHNYKIDNLKKVCTEHLKKNLTECKEACEALLLAEECEDSDLEMAVHNYFMKHSKIMKSEVFKEFMNSYPILASKVLYRKLFPRERSSKRSVEKQDNPSKDQKKRKLEKDPKNQSRKITEFLKPFDVSKNISATSKLSSESPEKTDNLEESEAMNQELPSTSMETFETSHEPKDKSPIKTLDDDDTSESDKIDDVRNDDDDDDSDSSVQSDDEENDGSEKSINEDNDVGGRNSDDGRSENDDINEKDYGEKRMMHLSP